MSLAGRDVRKKHICALCSNNVCNLFSYTLSANVSKKLSLTQYRSNMKLLYTAVCALMWLLHHNHIPTMFKGATVLVIAAGSGTSVHAIGTHKSTLTFKIYF